MMGHLAHLTSSIRMMSDMANQGVIDPFSLAEHNLTSVAV